MLYLYMAGIRKKSENVFVSVSCTFQLSDLKRDVAHNPPIEWLVCVVQKAAGVVWYQPNSNQQMLLAIISRRNSDFIRRDGIQKPPQINLKKVISKIKYITYQHNSMLLWHVRPYGACKNTSLEKNQHAPHFTKLKSKSVAIVVVVSMKNPYKFIKR